MPDDLVQVLKTQDAGYIRTHKAMEQSRVQRLQQQLDSLVDQALAPAPTTSGDGDEEMDDWDAFDEVPVASTSAAPQRKHMIFSTDLETGESPSATRFLLLPLTLRLFDSPHSRSHIATLQAQASTNSLGW